MKTSLKATLSSLGLVLALGAITIPAHAFPASYAVFCQGGSSNFWVDSYNSYSDALSASYRCERQGGTATIEDLR